MLFTFGSTFMTTVNEHVSGEYNMIKHLCSFNILDSSGNVATCCLKQDQTCVTVQNNGSVTAPTLII